jgi:uncharacterized protein GlcG (DUF336 family)
MFEKTILDADDAMAAVTAALASAPGAAATPVAVAVVNEYGDLMAFARLDATAPFNCQYAIKKAVTAAKMRAPIAEVTTQLREHGRSMTEFEDSDLVASFGGGLPIMSDRGECVGGLGVSGGSPDQDEAIARAGLRGVRNAQ